MAKRRSFIDRLPLAPVFALMFGTAVAIVVAAMPQWRFEQMIGASGLGSLLAVAQPPLGLKARLLAVALGFALVALLIWGAVTLVLRLLESRAATTAEDDTGELDLETYGTMLPPVDAPRRPIFADKELGAPLMSDAALKSLVVTPTLAEPDVADNAPIAPVAEAEDARQPEFADALETPLQVEEFDLPPVAGESEAPVGESSIDTLIRRLEAGLARRAGPPPPNSPSSGPLSSNANPAAVNPVGVMRDILAMNRDPAADNDASTARALDTLQAMATRRMAG